MAEGKKSFIAYSDWNGMFKALPDEVAGKLIKHIFSYVNDEAPETDDYIIKALFEQIKATLKRDLQKWDKQRYQRIEAGKKSAEVRATKSNERSTSVNETERNPTVNDNVSVSVIVNDNDILLEKETKEKFNFKKSLLEICSNENLVDDWMRVRKEKKAVNTKTSFDRIILEIERSGKSPEYCIQMAVFKSWKGFEAKWLENLNNGNNGSGTKQTRIENFEQGFREQFAGKDLSVDDGF